VCKDQGRPYGYYVETTGPQLSPRLLWRVYVNDGHMELVRGALFKQLDTRALRSDIVAAGSDSYVYNRPEPLPSSIGWPSLLFGELEIQRANRPREKLPQYPAPALSTVTATKECFLPRSTQSRPEAKHEENSVRDIQSLAR